MSVRASLQALLHSVFETVVRTVFDRHRAPASDVDLLMYSGSNNTGMVTVPSARPDSSAKGSPLGPSGLVFVTVHTVTTDQVDRLTRYLNDAGATQVRVDSYITRGRLERDVEAVFTHGRYPVSWDELYSLAAGSPVNIRESGSAKDVPAESLFRGLSPEEKRAVAQETASVINDTLARLFLRLGPPPESLRRSHSPTPSSGGGAQQ
jgi:hypothetical protein